MTGQAVHQDARAAFLLRIAELEKELSATKERLNLAAAQLEGLAQAMLARDPLAQQRASRPWLQDLVTNQLVADVQDAERRLARARILAAELGIEIE